MKIRLGQLTGTPTSDGENSAGCYFALSDDRNELVGLRGIYYEGIKIWPDEGFYRISSIRLTLTTELSNLILKYQLSTNDFTGGNGQLILTVGSRTFSRSSIKAEIRWDADTQTLFFLNNNGPFADVILRGDYINLSVSMARWSDTIIKDDATTGWDTVLFFQPVTTCSIYIGATWDSTLKIAGAAAVYNESGSLVGSVQAYIDESKKFLSTKEQYVGEETALSSVTYSGHISLYGEAETSKAIITYPANAASFTARVVEVSLQS